MLVVDNYNLSFINENTHNDAIWRQVKLQLHVKDRQNYLKFIFRNQENLYLRTNSKTDI